MEECIMVSGIKANKMDMESLLRMELQSTDNGKWGREYDGLIEKKQKE